MASLTESSKLALTLRSTIAVYAAIFAFGGSTCVALWQIRAIEIWQLKHGQETAEKLARLEAEDRVLSDKQAAAALTQEQLRGDVKAILGGIDHVKEGIRDLKAFQAGQVIRARGGR